MYDKKLLVIPLVVFAAIVAIAVSVRMFAVPALAPETDAESADHSPAYVLSDEERAMVDAYTAEQREVADLLAANIWSAADGSAANAKFFDGYVVESADDDESVQRFVIGALEKDGDVYRGSALVSSGEMLFTLDWSDKDAPRIESKAFARSKVYAKSDPAVEFAATSLDGRVTELVGGGEQVQRVFAAVRDWASVNAPSARLAAWDGKASYDLEAQSVTLGFTLDDAKKTHVRATKPFEGEIKVEKG